MACEVCGNRASGYIDCPDGFSRELCYVCADEMGLINDISVEM